VLSLVDRSLLAVDFDDLIIPNPVRSFVLKPIENAILARCAGSRTAATAVLNDPAVEQACASYQAPLEQMQLTPDAGLRAWRFNWFAYGAVILLGLPDQDRRRDWPGQIQHRIPRDSYGDRTVGGMAIGEPPSH